MHIVYVLYANDTRILSRLIRISHILLFSFYRTLAGSL